ncbi:MAG: tRNA epoxyqueuosine(34) reductase QueG [Candidatus Poribacteria bacterium]|nr:tRNA epoxyqueuosine(34) reductase QueG [Candidatus Poribacteria bacterium]
MSTTVNRAPDDLPDLTTRLKARALELGFDAVGITPITPYPHADAFTRWLENGYHGEMAYLERNAERRLDPREVVRDAQSIVCLLKCYRTDEIPEDLLNDRTRGIFSRYAWGDDYHDVIGKSLKRLYEWIETDAEDAVEGRVYVDAGPVLEREAAAFAGLGWIGKNTMLLNRAHGSYFFLAEIITNVAFTPDAPTTDHCGSCTKCLDACPTDAFPSPHVLDATKCISYLTIEQKGAIPKELREGIGNRVFGCDICQEVCPWNRKPELWEDEASRPREGSVAPPLVELMGLDDEGFRERFRKSPIKRTKRRGLLRNVAVALGNAGDRAAVPALIAALGDDEPLVRAHAAWALGRIGGEDTVRALRSALEREDDPDVCAEIVAAIPFAEAHP